MATQNVNSGKLDSKNVLFHVERNMNGFDVIYDNARKHTRTRARAHMHTFMQT